MNNNAEPPSIRINLGRNRIALLGLACACLTALGCIGPWVSFLGIGITGTSATGGKVDLFLSITGGAALGVFLAAELRRKAVVLAISAACFAAALAVGIANWSDLERHTLFGEIVIAQVGWGLVLTTVGSAGGLACASALLIRQYRARRTTAWTDRTEATPNIGEWD